MRSLVNRRLLHPPGWAAEAPIAPGPFCRVALLGDPQLVPGRKQRLGCSGRGIRGYSLALLVVVSVAACTPGFGVPKTRTVSGDVDRSRLWFWVLAVCLA